MFNRVIIFLLFHFLFYQFANGQSKSQQVIDIERIFSKVETPIVKVSDTTRLNNFADSVAKEGNIEKTEYTRFYIFLQKKKIFRGDSILSYFNKWIETFASSITPGVKSVSKFYYGQNIFEGRDYSTGIQLILEAKSEFGKIGYENIPEISIPFYVLSLHYYDFKNYKKSLEYALIANKFRLQNVTVGTNNTVGLTYQKLGMYDSAIIKFKETMEQAKKENDYTWYAIASGNTGRTYCLNKEYFKGIPYLRIDAQAGLTGTEPINSALSALYIAEAYNQQLLTDSAEFYIHFARKLVKDRGEWNSDMFYLDKFCYYYYIQLANLYKLKNNYAEAYKNLDTASINKEKFDSRFDWQLLTSEEKRIEGLEYQQNINLLASQKKNQQLQKLILFILLGAVLLFAIFLQYWQKIKRKKEKQLAAEKEANLLLKQEKAEQELETAREQLDELIIKFQEKSSLKENLAADLAEVSRNENITLSKEQASKIINELTGASLLTNQDWQLFQQRFEKVYVGFFTNLSQAVPDITPAEERMLALHKLKVNYRQMAQMLGISPQSARTAKYRLRKKLLLHNQSELLVDLED